MPWWPIAQGLVWSRRLFAVRVFCVLAYSASLPFAWFRTQGPSILGSEPAIDGPVTGWEAVSWAPLFVIFLATLAAAARLRPRRRWLRWLLAVTDVLFSLTAALVGEFAVSISLLFSSSLDHRPAYFIGRTAIWLFFVGSFLQRSQKLRAIEETRTTTGIEARSGSVTRDPRSGATELVLLIHGTGSGVGDDEGDRWWQAGSDFCRELESRLPERIRVHRMAEVGPAEVFHWGSGPNRESRRRAAGEALLRHLEDLAPRWSKLHLIGHSHGGSVVWHALRRWARDGDRDKIGSVVTLGTPFLRLAPNNNLAASVGLLVLLVVFGWACRDLFRDAVEAGLGVWFHPQSWWVVLALGATAVVGLAAGWNAVQVAVRWFKAFEERLRDAEAFEVFRDRLHCIYSPNDEAINGLRTAISTHGGLIVAATPSDHVGQSPWRVPLQTAYEDFLGPMLDQAVWRRTTRRLQGIDIPGGRFISAAPGPVVGVRPQPLPDRVSAIIDTWVADHSTAALSRIRESLGVFWASGVTVREIGQSVQSKLAGKELVHWAYYQVSDVLDLVARALVDPVSSGEDRWHSVETSEEVRPPSPLSTKSVLATLGTAAVMLAACWSFMSVAWWRQVVYPLTDRYQVFQALQDPPLEEAFRQGAIDEMVRWEWATESTASPAPEQPDAALLSWFNDFKSHFHSVCRAVARVATGDELAQAVVTILEDESPSQQELRPLEGYVSAKEVATLAAALRPRLADYVRSCIGFRPSEAFFLDVHRRYPVAVFSFYNREAAADNRAVAAIYLARAWSFDSEVHADLLLSERDLAGAESGDLGVRDEQALRDRVARARAWAAEDLAAILVAFGDSRSLDRAVEVMVSALAAEPGRYFPFERVLCGPNGAAIETELSAHLEPNRQRQVARALRRCNPVGRRETGAARRTILSWADSGVGSLVELERAVDVATRHADGLGIDAQTLEQILDGVQTAAETEERTTSLRCDLLALVARAGELRTAREAARDCGSVHRLRILTELVVRYRLDHPDHAFSALSEEAERVIP